MVHTLTVRIHSKYSSRKRSFLIKLFTLEIVSNVFPDFETIKSENCLAIDAVRMDLIFKSNIQNR